MINQLLTIIKHYYPHHIPVLMLQICNSIRPGLTSLQRPLAASLAAPVACAAAGRLAASRRGNFLGNTGDFDIKNTG